MIDPQSINKLAGGGSCKRAARMHPFVAYLAEILLCAGSHYSPHMHAGGGEFIVGAIATRNRPGVAVTPLYKDRREDVRIEYREPSASVDVDCSGGAEQRCFAVNAVEYSMVFSKIRSLPLEHTFTAD